ncbi:hypothetical protein DWY00_01170 [Roseburia sp. AF22-8AC]|nr:hypothetical protein DWY00_01170 [Roseburia sp. AF22-8AC]
MRKHAVLGIPFLCLSWDTWISPIQQATPASWMCRRGGMEHGCNFSPFAGKKIYLREILVTLKDKEGMQGQRDCSLEI